MKNDILFSIETATLSGVNGSPDKDRHGKYNCIVGAFNVMSSKGQFYELTELVRSIYKPGSQFMMNVSNGLPQEVNHPSFSQGMTIEDYIARLLVIDNDNVCGIITDIKLDATPTKVPFQRKPLYLVKAKVEPAGKRAEVLDRRLKDPNNDTAFSLRALNNARKVNGVLYKEVHTPIAYDLVDRPGIPVAKKSIWTNLSLESDGIDVRENDLDKVKETIERLDDLSLEDNYGFLTALKEVVDNCDGDCIYRDWL